MDSKAEEGNRQTRVTILDVCGCCGRFEVHGVTDSR